MSSKQDKQHLNNNKKLQKNNQEISRKEALGKLGNYGKYATLTALGTYILLNPMQSQAQSIPDPGSDF